MDVDPQKLIATQQINREIQKHSPVKDIPILSITHTYARTHTFSSMTGYSVSEV